MIRTFNPIRVALSAGVLTAVLPTVHSRIVKIGNATPDDLKVYDANDPTESKYFVVAAGYEKEIDLQKDRFDPYLIAFYLKATQDGTAVLIWL